MPHYHLPQPLCSSPLPYVLSSVPYAPASVPCNAVHMCCCVLDFFLLSCCFLCFSVYVVFCGIVSMICCCCFNFWNFPSSSYLLIPRTRQCAIQCCPHALLCFGFFVNFLLFSLFFSFCCFLLNFVSMICCCCFIFWWRLFLSALVCQFFFRVCCDMLLISVFDLAFFDVGSIIVLLAKVWERFVPPPKLFTLPMVAVLCSHFGYFRAELFIWLIIVGYFVFAPTFGCLGDSFLGCPPFLCFYPIVIPLLVH